MAHDESTRILPEVARVGVGTQLSGIYELDERLASGGMGEVYRGHNIQTGDHVAIKIVLPEFARDETILSLFRKEASILNHLSHDAVVRYHVFSVDPGIGRPYLAMEFVDGEPLSDVLRKGPLPAETVLRLCLRLAEGLAAVHQAHTFHRDLSPDNIILPEGRVERAKIIDFGIARSTKIGEGTLLGGRFAGKYNYVSPEQLGLHGGEVGAPSDIYSLGLVLAAALRGKPLDMSGSQWEVVEKRRTLPDLTDIDAEVLPMLETMLQPDPDHRPASMAQIVAMARSLLPPPDEMPTWRPTAPPAAGQPPPAAPPSFVAHVPPVLPSQPPPAATAPASERPSRTRTALIATAALVLVAAGAGAYLTGLVGIGPRDPIPSPPPPVETDVQEPPSQPEPEPEPEPPLPQPEPEPEPQPEPVPEPPQPQPVPLPLPEPLPQPQPEPLPLPQPEPQPLPEPLPEPETPQPEPEPEPLPEPVPEPLPEPEPEPPLPLPEPEPERASPTETVNGLAERVAWLRGYPGGECFHATVTSATDSTTEIEGFGTTVEPFAEMLAAFRGRFGMEPTINVRPIAQTQCAITDFLRGLDAIPADPPQLELHRTLVPSGSPVSGAVEFSGGQSVSLLLIDHKGMAFSLDGRLTTQQQRATFSIPIALSAADRAAGLAVPQVVIAVTTPNGISATAFASPTPASVVLPAILAEIRARGLQGAATAKFFRLGG